MRIAALDLGSNSFHLIVVEAHADGHFETLLREKDVLRLAESVATTHRIPPDKVDAAIESISRMRAHGEAIGVDEWVVYATSALREAENGAEVVDLIEQETGVGIQVITGLDEARLIFAAVRASVLIDKPPAVCIDQGGGSLEVSVGDASGMLWATSLKLGAARLTAEFMTSDPPDPIELTRVRDRARALLGPVAQATKRFRPGMLVGTSGTLTSLARLAAPTIATATPNALHQLTVTAKELERVHKDMQTMTVAERRSIEGLDARRADIMPAGSVVLQVAMELFGFDELTVSEWSMREGMILDAIGHHDALDWVDPRSMRRESVHALFRRYGGNEAHAHQVARFATAIFDDTIALHGLSPVDRELLEHAAWLHDIGEHVAVDNHDKHSAYLIEHGRLRGFPPEEVVMLATICRFHRRGTPKPASYEPMRQLDDDERDRVTKLVAILRVADGLDRSHNDAVDLVTAVVRDDKVELVIEGSEDTDLERWGVRRKRGLFEKAFGLPIELVDEPS
ncbi:MAG TPA: Ppx/GppA phosphatase family protein [Acidimicrobiales bacterium]|nr:Ppx/GppA phosphatase family protein [Acidimicrobiales bacterium]